MKKLGICFLFVTGLGLSLMTAHAQQPAAGKSVLRLDPALDAIISPNAKLETLKDDYFGFIEGPVWVPAPGGGFLAFSDIPANKIYKWDPKAGLSIYVDKSGFTGNLADLAPANLIISGRLTVPLIGSNGLQVDKEGRLLVCTHGDRTLWRLEKDGTRTLLADKFEGKRLSGPNDLTVKSDGSIYFSDRGSGLRGGMSSPARELDFNGVMRWKDGKVDLMAKDDNANGVALSKPDEKYLYVISAGKIDRYDVKPDGTIANRQVGFVDMTVDKAPGGPDGMKVDRRGNIFSVGPGGAWIISPAGKLLGKVLLPTQAANLALGDADGMGLYFTARNTLYHIRLASPAL